LYKKTCSSESLSVSGLQGSDFAFRTFRYGGPILLLDKLGLVGMKTKLTEVMDLTKEQSANTTVYEILKRLLEAECEYKKSRSLSYRLELAKFPTIKLLSDTSQAKLVENIDIQKVVDNHENIMLIGGSGSAKTHLAIGFSICSNKKELQGKILYFK